MWRTSYIMQVSHALILWNVMIICLIEKAFKHWISIEFHRWCKYLWQRKKELFPVKFNYSGPLDWKTLFNTCELNQEHKLCESFPTSSFTYAKFGLEDHVDPGPHEQHVHDFITIWWWRNIKIKDFAVKMNWIYTHFI